MARSSDQIEREIEQARIRLADDLAELRLRVTPGQVVDQIADYTRDGPAAEFVSNLGREIRQNPLPLLLTAAGIAWLMIASGRSRPRSVDTLPGTPNSLPIAARESYEWDEAVEATAVAE